MADECEIDKTIIGGTGIITAGGDINIGGISGEHTIDRYLLPHTIWGIYEAIENYIIKGEQANFEIRYKSDSIEISIEGKNNTKIILIIGDITEQETDSIVNAANPGLLGGGEWMVQFTGKEDQRYWRNVS